MRLQKTKIPARGLKPILYDLASRRDRTILQKTKIPARGLKPVHRLPPNVYPRAHLQKTKIPARGLKQEKGAGIVSGNGIVRPSKNQNPREGIETGQRTAIYADGRDVVFKKPKSPRGD